MEGLLMAEPEKVYGSQLGRYMDGWADLIEGMGEEAEGVRAIVLEELKERNMPDVTIKAVTMKEGITSSKSHREYIITTTFPGVTTTICVEKHGCDLFASWRTFIRTTINGDLIEIYVGIALVLEAIGYIMLNWPGSLGQLVEKIGEDISNNNLFVKEILYFIPIFLVILFLAAVAGVVMKQNLVAFILKEPSLFDQEDMMAMSFTVHKTLLHALDTAGIDMSKLRVKGEFKAGRRGEQI